MFNLNILAFTLLIGFCCGEDRFYTKSGKIYDANGKEFIMRGINNAHVWFDGYGRNLAFNSIPTINSTGANTVRVVWSINPSGGLDINYLENIIKEYIKYKIVPIIELHDATGSSSADDLLKCANWFKANINLFNKYKKFVIINIANEWSPWGTDYNFWANSYVAAIKVIRSTGYNGALIVDASAYAQNPDSIISSGQKVLSGDSQGNIIFSLHMYSEWKLNGGRNVTSNLKAIQDKQFPIIIGEFASSHPEYNDCKWYPMSSDQIIKESDSRRIGFLGWSWHGNSNGDCVSGKVDLAPLNMVQGDSNVQDTWKALKGYTTWGSYFLPKMRSKSVRATVF